MIPKGICPVMLDGLRFNPISWFMKGEQGAWYDPSDLTTLFQDSAGITPMSAVGTVADQPVGLMLDKSKGLALGAELVTNGDFSNGTTGWTAQPDWTISTGVASYTKGTVLQYLQTDANISIVSGNWYKLTINFLSIGGASALFGLFNKTESVNYFGSYQTATSIGVKSFYFLASSTTTGVKLYANHGGSSFSISSFSIKQIAGNHAFQGDSTSTPAKRPMLSARVNLLTKTEDFNSWSRVNSNVNTTAGIAPDGTTTLNKLIPTASGRSAQYTILTTLVASVSYDFRVYVKQAELNWVYIRIYDGADKGAWFNTVTGLYGTVEAGATTRTPILVNGGYWIGVTVTSAAVSQVAVEPCDGNSVKTVSGNGVNGIYAWGADLRPTNAGALLPPYQRVNTASDYDTVGFPLYLKANGLSSAMSTNSIDFSGTDKMTVVTGVRKVADNAFALAMELSAIVGTANPGSFNIHAPFSSSANYTVYCIGSSPIASSTQSLLNYLAPISNVVTVSYNIGATNPDEIKLKVNSVFTGTQVGDTGSGNFGNYPLYLFSRAGTQLFLYGQFYGAIIRGAASDTASVTQTENYMAQKTGITF